MKGYNVYSKIQEMKELGFSQRRTAQQIGLHRATVNRYWGMSADEYDAMRQAIRKASLLDQYKEQIIGWLREYPTMTAAQIEDWLKEHYNAAFSGRTVSRYVKHLREEYGLKKESHPREYEAVPELPMGKQVQIDFGQMKLRNTSQGLTKVYAAAFVLSHSRYKYVYFQSRPFTSVDLVRICRDCFAYMGGVPEEVVFDQDSIVCVSENAGDIIYTHEFEKFRQEYRFSIWMCRGSDPESKGKIENVVKYVKGNFLNNRLYVNDETLNEEGLKWLARTANAKIHGTTKRIPAEVFQEERKNLRPLPVYSVPAPQLLRRTVRKDNTIFYCSNRYSVPLGTYTGQSEVQIEAVDGRLRVLTLAGEMICEHPISTGCGMLIQNKNHLRDRTTPLDRLMEGLDADLGGKALSFLQAVRAEKPRYTRDQFLLLRSLLERFGVKKVLQAIDFCERGRLYSANTVRDFLEHQAAAVPGTMQPVPVAPAVPIDDPKYHVAAQKRPLEEYAKVGVSK